MALEELVVVVHVVDAWEDLFKVTKSKLFLLKVKYDGEIVFCEYFVLRLAQLSHEFAQV